MHTQLSVYQKAFCGISQKVDELAREISLRSSVFENPLKLKVENNCPFSYWELKYVEYLANGHRAAGIAAIEGTSERTVEARMQKLTKKAAVTTLPALVAFFMRNGWIK